MELNGSFKTDGVLSLIGNTPLLQLSKFFAPAHFDVHAKLEMFNPGGSVKDRAALNMLKDAWNKGIINENSTINYKNSGDNGKRIDQFYILPIISQIVSRNRVKSVQFGKLCFQWRCL